MTGSPVIIRTIEAPPITRGDTTITPLMQVILFRIRLPIYKQWAGYYQWWGWKRPAGVIIQAGNHPPQRIPIIDLTRVLQIGILGFGLMIAVVFGRRLTR